MPTDASSKLSELYQSNRWKQFVESISTGLQLSFEIFSVDSNVCFQTGQICPMCSKDYSSSSHIDVIRELLSIDSFDYKETILEGNVTAVIHKLHGSFYLAALECPVCSEIPRLPVKDRSYIAQKLITSFILENILLTSQGLS